MSDQAEMQSPQVRMEALLGDVPDTPQPEDKIEASLEGEEEEIEESAESEEESDDEQGDEESEDDEEDSEEQPVQSLKLKVDGEEIDKPIDEVIALAQQGLDYTKKTQEVATQRKALEEYAQTVKVQEQQFREQVELNNALIGEIAQLSNIDNQLAQFEGVNWQELSDADFVEAQKLFFTFNQLQQKRGALTNDLAQKQQYIQQQQQQKMLEMVEKGKEVLAKEIPNWSSDTNRSLIAVGKEYGFTDDELGMIVDPRHVKVLHDAMQWKKLQSSNVAKNKVATAKPMVKAGAKETKNVANSQQKANRDALRKSGRSEYAAKLIENMI